MVPYEIGQAPFDVGSFWTSLAALHQKSVRYSTVIDIGCADGSFFISLLYFGIFAGATPVNIEANPLYEGSLRAIQDVVGGHYVIGAASDADGEAEMTLGAHPYWSSLRDKDDRYWKQIHNLSEGTSKVRTFTLDGLTDRLGLKAPYLLKLDVQGAEAQVLRGARRVLERTDVLICETDMSDFQSTNRVLLDAGFDLFDLTQFGRIDDYTLGWFYPVYLNRRLDSVKASTLWNPTASDQVLQKQAQRRASLLQVNARVLAELRAAKTGKQLAG